MGCYTIMKTVKYQYETSHNHKNTTEIGNVFNMALVLWNIKRNGNTIRPMHKHKIGFIKRLPIRHVLLCTTHTCLILFVEADAMHYNKTIFFKLSITVGLYFKLFILFFFQRSNHQRHAGHTELGSIIISL